MVLADRDNTGSERDHVKKYLRGIGSYASFALQEPSNLISLI
jgi:hypothetical protein